MSSDLYLQSLIFERLISLIILLIFDLSQVASIVAECTDDKTLHRDVRKALQIERAPRNSMQVYCSGYGSIHWSRNHGDCEQYINASTDRDVFCASVTWILYCLRNIILFSLLSLLRRSWNISPRSIFVRFLEYKDFGFAKKNCSNNIF